MKLHARMTIPRLAEFAQSIKQLQTKIPFRVSSRGWAKILVKYGTDDDSRLVKLCDFSKIEQRSWKYIEKEKPELLLYKL